MENIGTVRQPLVGGTVISEALQEDFGLLSYGDGSGTCRGPRRCWATIGLSPLAHCVEIGGGSGNVIPDPTRPGQNMLQPLANITLTAAWNPPQSQQALRRNHFSALRRGADPTLRAPLPFTARRPAASAWFFRSVNSRISASRSAPAADLRPGNLPISHQASALPPCRPAETDCTAWVTPEPRATRRSALLVSQRKRSDDRGRRQRRAFVRLGAAQGTRW